MSEEKKDKGLTRRDFMKSVGVAAAAGGTLSMALPKKAHAAKTLKIGFMAPYTGPASRTGDLHRKGVEMALEDARAAGEIPVKVDRKSLDIEPVWVDSQSSPEKAVKAVTQATVHRSIISWKKASGGRGTGRPRSWLRTPTTAEDGEKHWESA